MMSDVQIAKVVGKEAVQSSPTDGRARLTQLSSSDSPHTSTEAKLKIYVPAPR